METTQNYEEFFMKKALEMVNSYFTPSCVPISTILADQVLTCPFQAEKALATNETPVGCVLVHQGEIIGSGMNDTNRSLNVRQPLLLSKLLDIPFFFLFFSFFSLTRAFFG